MIRDLGVVLAMHNDRSTVRMVLSAQMAKAGPPMNGKDLHVGDWSRGIFPRWLPSDRQRSRLQESLLRWDGNRRRHRQRLTTPA